MAFGLLFQFLFFIVFLKIEVWESVQKSASGRNAEIWKSIKMNRSRKGNDQI